jgi:SNF2 family DNA or RNA helicase
MGLGKTLSVICLLAMDWSHCPPDSSGQRLTLLVVQPSLLATREAEIGKHFLPQSLRCWRYHGPNRLNGIAAMLTHDVVLTTYDLVATEWRNLDCGPKPLFSTTWRRIVLDEGEQTSWLTNVGVNSNVRIQPTKYVLALQTWPRLSVHFEGIYDGQ